MCRNTEEKHQKKIRRKPEYLSVEGERYELNNPLLGFLQGVSSSMEHIMSLSKISFTQHP